MTAAAGNQLFAVNTASGVATVMAGTGSRGEKVDPALGATMTGPGGVAVLSPDVWFVDVLGDKGRIYQVTFDVPPGLLKLMQELARCRASPLVCIKPGQ